MAHIRANTKNGKIVSYRFTVCLGRYCNGKQIRKYTTWPIPPDTSTAKAKKLLNVLLIFGNRSL